MTFEEGRQLLQEQIDANNAWSAQQAEKQMVFQKEMSSTAHQREVEDLKAAGLNPILSAHTNGASTPAGAMAQGDSSATSALVDLMSTVIATDAANARAAAYNAQANLIQSQNYSKNPWLSLLQDVVEDRTGKPFASTVNGAIDWALDRIGLNNSSAKSVSTNHHSGKSYQKTKGVTYGALTALRGRSKIIDGLSSASFRGFNR